MKKRRLAIIGAGALGQLIVYHAIHDAGFEVAGYYDDFSKAELFEDYPVLGTAQQIQRDYLDGKFDVLIIGIGYNHMAARNKYLHMFKGQIPFANIIHTSSYVDKSTVLGEGIFILPGVTIDTGVTIQDNVLINAGSLIAHHSIIGKNSFIAPGVNIAGLVKIGQSCFIGIGSTILDSLVVADYSTVGGGAVVIKNTEPYSVSMGVPSRIVKYKTAE